jgi:hypothetical protein
VANSNYLASWNLEKKDLLHNIPGLLVWLGILQELPTFGVRRDSARIRMLERVISDAA